MRLAGKVAVVTGSSRGIGKAIALAFAREGASVVVAARTETTREGMPGTIGETVAAIRALGGRAVAVHCDVTQEEDTQRAMRAAVEEFGGLDILVNNAGMAYSAPLVDIVPKHWDLVMRVNTKGTFLCCKAAIPLIAARGGGSIVNVSSPCATELTLGIPGGDGKDVSMSVLYGASKAAVDRMTLGLAPEVAAQNIAVNAIKPLAPTDSEGIRSYPGIDPAQLVSPDVYVTKGAIFLATQDARGITGRIFNDQDICREYSLT